jgi:hypothetical protein
MSNDHGTVTIDVDEKRTDATVNEKPSDSHPKQEPGKHLTTRRKRVLLISGAMVVVIAAAYFLWNASHFEDTDDAQVDGHVMPAVERTGDPRLDSPRCAELGIHRGGGTPRCARSSSRRESRKTGSVLLKQIKRRKFSRPQKRSRIARCLLSRRSLVYGLVRFAGSPWTIWTFNAV